MFSFPPEQLGFFRVVPELPSGLHATIRYDALPSSFAGLRSASQHHVRLRTRPTQGRLQVDIIMRMASSSKHSADLIVVGAGLAGLGAAIAAARAGMRVRIVERRPQKPGNQQLRLPAAGRVPLPLEPGQKGIWTEYPNLLHLFDELVPGGAAAALSRPTSSGFYSPRGLEVNSPVLGRLPPLPAPFGSLVYTLPYFRQTSVPARLSALPLLPRLLDALAVSPLDENTRGLDELSAEDLFQASGLDDELYETFLRPVLQALLFRPPSELSAFITLRVLWCYVFKTQASFDVRWPVAPLEDLLVRPLVQEIETLGGVVDVGRELADLELDSNGRVAAVTLGGVAGAERISTGAVVFAAGAGGTRRALEGCSNPVRERLASLLQGLANVPATDCMAVRFALDRRCPARFSSNVLSGFEGLEETGATYYMVERLQAAHLQAHAERTPGGERLRDRSVIAVDFYGSDRGRLATMQDDEVVAYAMQLLRRAEPLAFKGAQVAQDIESTVLRARGAATHFAPGSRKHRPLQSTALPNLFLAGDYVKGLEHGAEGLSQERALVSGFVAANMAMGIVEESGWNARAPGSLRRQQVLELSADEPHVQLLRAAWLRQQ